jgi:hypothetical protein
MDFAAAIMSSAWGSDGHASFSAVSRVGVDNHSIAEATEIEFTPGTHNEEEAAEDHFTDHRVIPQDYPRARGTRAGGVLAKFKKFGGKMKRLLNWKSRGDKRKTGVSVDVDVDVRGRNRENHRVVLDTDRGVDMASQADNIQPALQLDSITTDDCILAAPPGLNVCLFHITSIPELTIHSILAPQT